MSMIDDTSRIAIEWACTRLINRYTLLNDAGDWEGLVALFTEDGLYARPTQPGKAIIGREALLETYRSRPADMVTRHVVSNVVVDVESETEARAMSVILLYRGTAPADASLPLHNPTDPLIGTFKDRLRKTADGWRFTERRGALDFAP
jgi:hypothetical protein